MRSLIWFIHPYMNIIKKKCISTNSSNFCCCYFQYGISGAVHFVSVNGLNNQCRRNNNSSDCGSFRFEFLWQLFSSFCDISRLVNLRTSAIRMMTSKHHIDQVLLEALYLYYSLTLQIDDNFNGYMSPFKNLYQDINHVKTKVVLQQLPKQYQLQSATSSCASQIPDHGNWSKQVPSLQTVIVKQL